MLIKVIQKVLVFMIWSLLFAFFASLIESNIKISLFFVDPIQRLVSKKPNHMLKGGRKSNEIITLLAVIIQVNWSAFHIWTGAEFFHVTNFTEMEIDTGMKSEQLIPQLANLSRLSHSRIGILFSTHCCVYITWHLLNNEGQKKIVHGVRSLLC